jgi:cell division septation protein DedD
VTDTDDTAADAPRDEEAPEAGPAPEEAGPAAEGPTCRSCGAPVDPRQLVCLECGARVALKEQRSWATEPLAPIAALLVVVIVIGAGLFGFAISELTSDDGGGGEAARQPAAATSEEPATESAPEAEGPAVVSGEGQGTERSEQPAPAEEPATNPNAIPGWPAGITAHTVVLVTTSDEPAARNVAREARRAGLEAGLIRSDPYDLGTGLWIVFTGRFDTREGAVRQAAGLQQQYPGAYPQLIQRAQ